MSQRHPSQAFRSRISDQPYGLRITIPLRRHWQEALEILIFFLGSLVGGIIPLLDVATNTGLYLGEQPLLRIGLGSAFLTCSALLLCLWLWMVAGREVIIVDYKSLTVRWEIFGIGLEGDYELRRMRQFRYCPQRLEPAPPFWRRREGRPLSPDLFSGDIAFDYEGESKNFGMGLERAEARHLVDLIKNHIENASVSLPRGVPDAPR